ncbi:MAG: winged helix-turn-helix domain-containing protein, partial [Gaiellales bacterium]
MPRIVDPDQARRIAVRAQLLDGSAGGVLDTVQRLGFLQLDPIATVATPQILVLWSRLGAFDPAELDRLLWQERALIEWDAYIWPIESLPMLRAWMRGYRRPDDSARGRWHRDFLARNRRFRTYVLGELERRGPLLSRELEDRSAEAAERHRWYGGRYVGRMLQLLHKRGEIAVVGRRGGARLWDLAERWYPPEDGRLTRQQAERRLAELQFRSLGVRHVRGEWHAHPDI